MSDTPGISLPRYDFVYLFDVTDGNPNGDPDAGNLPRIDPETGQGLVTDVCLKRKVRNYVALTRARDDRHRIFVQERAVLNELIEEAYSKSDEVKRCLAEWDEHKKNKASKKRAEKAPVSRPSKAFEDVARDWMCHNFFDIRTFGAVMSTGEEKAGTDEDGEPKSKIKRTAGQVRGPVQFAIGRSIDPIFSQEHAVTRCAVTNEKDFEKERTMGRKFTVPYGLFRAHGFINPFLAAQTGFSAADLELFKTALGQMFEFDRSAARGQMVPRRCIAFRHESELGNARADQLFDRVIVQLKDEVRQQNKPPRRFSEYTVTVDTTNLPKGITVEEWV